MLFSHSSYSSKAENIGISNHMAQFLPSVLLAPLELFGCFNTSIPFLNFFCLFYL